MPAGQYVSFGVFTNEKLPEYIIRNKKYTEVNLHGPTSFTLEEDDQKYPVVPFTVRIVRTCKEVVWIRLYLDGQSILSRPLVSSNEFTADGVKVGNEIRQLLFSLPKIAEDQEEKNPLGEFAGTIRMEVLEARFLGKAMGPVFQTDSAGCGGSSNHILYHLTKKDVCWGRTDAVGNVVSREGMTTRRINKTGKFRPMTKYAQTSNLLEEIVLHYRPWIPSHTPKGCMPPFPVKKEEEEEELHRTPLGDVSNRMKQSLGVNNSDGQKAEGSGEPWAQSSADLTVNMGNMAIRSGEENAACTCQNGGDDSKTPSEGQELESNAPENQSANSKEADSMETEDVHIHAAASLPQTGENSDPQTEHSHAMASSPQTKTGETCDAVRVSSVKSCATAVVPPMKIKHRESCAMAMVPPMNIKSRESCGSAMILPGNIKSRESCGSAMILPENIKSRESCASAMVPPMSIKHRESCGSAMILPENIKNRESCASAMVPPMNIKHRESCGSAMILPENIKKRESCASAMIPPENIKQRESCGSALIPPEKIKWRESCASAMIPPEKIKQRDSCASAMIPPENIKRRESCALAMIPPMKIKQRDSFESATVPPELMTKMLADEEKEAKPLASGYILVEESDSDDDIIFTYEVKDDSSECMEGEEELHEDSSIIYMGDDDCCVLDVSNRMSFVEIDDTVIDTE